MSFESFIALRYLKSRKRERFISVLTFLSIAGVALGVAVVFFVNSMMNGFETEVKSRIGGTISEITVYGYGNKGIQDYNDLIGEIKDVRGIASAAPIILGKAVAGSSYDNDGVLVRGVNPDNIGDVSNIKQRMYRGEFNFAPGNGLPGAVLGRGLARRLQVTIGDTVYIASLKGKSLSLGMSDVKITRFRLNGIFETGMYDYDDYFMFISIPMAQEIFKLRDVYTRTRDKLLSIGNPLVEPFAENFMQPASGFRPKDPVSAIQVKVHDPTNVQSVTKRLDDRIGLFYLVRNWIDTHANLFYWMKWEKILLTLAMLLIVAVATFNIISTLVMVVLEKQSEIAILKSMGAYPRSIIKIFMTIGLISGIVGTALGAFLGLLMCWLQIQFKIISLPGDIYFLSFLPIQMRLVDFVVICLAAILLTFLATIYPALRAGRLYPLEIIRYQ
jgi:lipoprotein-releasing system permease protein